MISYNELAQRIGIANPRDKIVNKRTPPPSNSAAMVAYRAHKGKQKLQDLKIGDSEN